LQQLQILNWLLGTKLCTPLAWLCWKRCSWKHKKCGM